MGDAILVTGGAGFIGSNLVRMLLHQTDGPVVVFDAFTYAGHPESLPDDPRVTVRPGDVAAPGSFATALDIVRPRAVFHLAAESHVDRSIDGPEGVVRTNVEGTLRVLEACRGYVDSLPVRSAEQFRAVIVSTDEVYGSLGVSGAFTEESPYAPNSPYAASKAAADHLARAWHATYGLPVVTTHCTNNYGPYQLPEKLIPRAIVNALAGRSIPVYGDGKQVRDWLHVEDHCAGLIAAWKHAPPGDVVGFGGNTERTNVALLQSLCDVLENRAPESRPAGGYRELLTPVADRPGHDRRYAFDARKAREQLGWKPKMTLDRGLDATVAWYLANRAWIDAVAIDARPTDRLGTLAAKPVAS